MAAATPCPDINGTHVMGQVKAGYAFDISPGFTVGTNVFYTVGDSSDSVIYVNKDSSTVTSKYKNTWGVSFEPGFNLNENLLVYGKLGYVRSDLSISVVNNANIGTASATLNGVLYGAGAKYLIDKDIYIGAEVAQYDYGSNSEILTLKGDPNILNHKNQQTVGVLSVGYYF